MTVPRAPIRAVVLLLASAAALSQQIPSQDPAIPPTIVHHPRPPKPKTDEPSFNPNIIVLDPAHGGADDGAHLPGGIVEKDVTIAFATRLRPLLEARGFTVVLTHAAATDDMAPDARVELANRSRAVACVILHASSGGHGVHLFTSSLAPLPASDPDPDSFRPIQPWGTAQAADLPRSTRLESDLASAINGIRVPLVAGAASIRPIDSLNCPAIALELAPLAPGSEGGQARVEDAGYQQRVAEATASALTLWRTHATALAMQAAIMRSAEAARRADASGQKPAEPRPKPKPRPKPAPPASYPDEAPAGEAAPVKKSAPIVRQPPPAQPPQVHR